MALIYANDFAALANIKELNGSGFGHEAPQLQYAQFQQAAMLSMGLNAPSVLGAFFNSNQHYWCPVFYGVSALNVGSTPITGLVLECTQINSGLLNSIVDEYGKATWPPTAATRAKHFSLPLRYSGDEIYISVCLTTLMTYANDQSFIDPTYVPEFFTIGYDRVSINQDKTISVNGVNTGVIGTYNRATPVKQQYDFKVTKTRLVVKVDGVIIADQARDPEIPLPDFISLCSSRVSGNGGDSGCEIVIHSVVAYDNSGTTMNTEMPRLRAKTFLPNHVPDSAETQSISDMYGNIGLDIPNQDFTDDNQRRHGGMYFGNIVGQKNTWSATKTAIPGTMRAMALLIQSRLDEPSADGFAAQPFLVVNGVEHMYEGVPPRCAWSAQFIPVLDIADLSFTTYKIGYRTGYSNVLPATVQTVAGAKTYARPTIAPKVSSNAWLVGTTVSSEPQYLSGDSYQFESDGWLGNKQTGSYQSILNTSYQQVQ